MAAGMKKDRKPGAIAEGLGFWGCKVLPSGISERSELVPSKLGKKRSDNRFDGL